MCFPKDLANYWKDMVLLYNVGPVVILSSTKTPYKEVKYNKELDKNGNVKNSVLQTKNQTYKHTVNIM